jgi:hypothetical protein
MFSREEGRDDVSVRRLDLHLLSILAHAHKQNDPAAAEGVLNVLAPLGLTSAIPAV